MKWKWEIPYPDELRAPAPVSRQVLCMIVVITNLLGVGVVLLLVTVVVPSPNIFDPSVAWISAVVAPAYVIIAITGGWIWVDRRIFSRLHWTRLDQPLTPEQQRNAFLAPGRVALIAVGLWAVGALLFSILYGSVSYAYIPKLAFGICFGGIVLSASSYLIVELVLRPAAAVALEAERPLRRPVPGVMGRTTVSWLLGSGLPLIGIILGVLLTLFVGGTTTLELALAVVLLASLVFIFGLASNLIAGWLTATSVRAVHKGLQRVNAGDLDCKLAIFDCTELGDLQRGFNEMVDGLRQSEQVRDLFARYVGRDVAAAAEEQQFGLGGVERHVAVLFVDIIGYSRLIMDRPAADVVRLLNRFFAVIVEEVERRGGLINKFEGDATLAIFGAPNSARSPETDALAAARGIARRLAEEVQECPAGIGIAAGKVMAGNVGAYERYEYTVIGEAVNLAARLCEVAKSDPSRVLASVNALRASDADEQECWQIGRQTVIRGFGKSIRVASPRTDVLSRTC